MPIVQVEKMRILSHSIMVKKMWKVKCVMFGLRNYYRIFVNITLKNTKYMRNEMCNDNVKDLCYI